MREAPYFVLNILSKQATNVFSSPGTSALVCKALQVRKTFWKKFTFNKKTSYKQKTEHKTSKDLILKSKQTIFSNTFWEPKQ